MLESFLYLIILLVIILVFGSMALAGFSTAPWVPSRKKDLSRLAELTDIKEGDLVYDLGSGDGRIVFELAKKYKAKIVGFEISVLPYLISKIRLWVMNTFFVHKLKGEVKILYKDFFLADFSKADVIIFFLTPMGASKLAPKFKKEMKRGSRILSCIFPIRIFKPKAVSKPKKNSNPIYLYQF